MSPTLQEIFARYESLDLAAGTDKTTHHSYGAMYESILAPLRSTATHVLEIGIYSGASLAAFRDYFHNAHVDGIDITMKHVLPQHRNLERTTIHIMDGTSPDAVQALHAQTYDVIVDDASHVPRDQVESFRVFAPYIKVGGVYFIEDIDGNHEHMLRQQLGEIAHQNNLCMEWYDFRSMKNRHDDIVAVFRRQ